MKLGIVSIYLQVIQSSGARGEWYTNENHRWMLNVEDLLIKRQYSILLHGDAGVNAQKWIREIVA